MKLAVHRRCTGSDCRQRRWKQDTGARALRSIIEEFMLDIMYEVPKDDNIGRVTITGDYIRGTGDPLIDIRSNGYSLEERDQMKQIAAAETKEA